MKTCFRWIVYWVAILAITVPTKLYAACEIVGTTPDGGYIIACDGPDTIGIISGDCSDIITINAGAGVSKMDAQSLPTTATANATTIDAGNGNNQIANMGSIEAAADANASPVIGTASQATTTATAIKAGGNPDAILNFSTTTSTATSNSTSGDISITLEGNNQSQSVTRSTAAATGIAGGGGNNEITNSGVITVTGTAQSDAPFIGLNIMNTAYADVSVTAAATGTGVSGQGSIVNEQTGTITVAVSSLATTGEFNADIDDSAKADANTTAEATAAGIAGSGANDTITSAGTITVNATSNAEGSVDLESSTDAEINATIEAKSSTTGIDGRGGDDTITNQSALSAISTASAASDNINTSIWAPGVTDTTVKSIAVSTGILSGSGKDVITNEGSMTIYSEATTELSNVLLSGGIEVALPTDVKGGATSEATATGVDAGGGDDQITNNSTLNAFSKASTSSEGVLLTVVGIGTFASPTTSTARSTGIDGGAGKDEITNSATITANAASSAEALSVTVSGFQYEATSDGDAKTRSEAYATGIAGGDEDDKVTNTGTVVADASATASTTDISVEGLGASRSNSSTTAGAFATGINGGTGNDEISNSGTITANATSEVNVVSIDLKYIALPLQPAQWFGADLGDARTEAQVTATGIDGGEGGDTISNSGTMDVYANAKADSDKIVSMLEIQSVSKSPQTAASGGNLQASTAVGATSTTMQATAAGNSEGDNEITDTGTIAQATATGIVGGAGNDTIANSNKIYAKAESEANSLSISATIAIGKGGTLDLIPDSAIIDATTTAQATVKGIDGGIGNDTITNLNEISAEAISNATSASIGVLFKGITEFKSATGIALSDATTKALSTATGVAGGDGDDTITNSGKIKSTATSDADSASISVALVGLKEGLVGGVSYADATTTAEGTTIGIDGGAGNDTINNSGQIEVAANSTSSSASIGVSGSGAFSQEWSAAFGVTLTDGTTKAISNATGINGGDGIDIITNFNKNTVTSTSDADSASVSVSLVGEESGLTLGVSYADATTTAEANAVGIDGGAGNDTIINTSTGQIEVTADPTSNSASVSATITGVTKGTGIVGGAAVTDGTTKAISDVAGIKGGDGDDTIANSGKITVKSNPDANSASVSVNLGASGGELGLVGGVSYADATTTAEATAIGIDGGAGYDTITNTGEIGVTTEPTASSASIAMTAQGVKGMGAAVGVSLTDGTTKAISTATGIAGGEGDDTITSSGSITVNALPDADSASVSVSLSAAKEGVAAGGTFADTTTIAQATATGIDGGQGNDTIANSGQIEVAANSTSSSVSIGVTITGVKEGAGLGVALTDGTTKALSTATGIKGGDGNNIIANSGNITVTATSDADSASVSATLGGTSEGLVAGVSYADATTMAEATAIGIETGRENDIIQNDGVLNVTSEATATSASVAVNAGGAVEGAAVGVALTDAETRAKSSSTGIEAGEGENAITNTGTITVSAKSDVTAASVSVDFEATGTGVAGGASLANGDTTVETYAIGINNGSGKGTIINNNVISVNAESTSTLASISVAVHGTPEGISLGAALASASNTAKANAIGIQGGNDNDIIANTGTITVSATTNADTTSVALDAECAPVGLGASLAKSNTTAEAIATGLSGGSGDDEITNTGTINADSSAVASSKAISVSIATASYSSADVSTTATAKSTGIDGGSGADLLRNEGTIDLQAASNADGRAGSANLIGYAAANVDITAEATITGIDGGAEYSDTNNIINLGMIKAASDATAKGLSVSVNLLGGVATDANTTARAITTGIKGGVGDDQILNQGNIDLTAKSNADVLGVSVTLGGYSDSNAESKGESMATGINAGDGVNTIVSKGSIKVSSEAYADTASVSVNLLGYAAAKGGATASTTAIGIASGKDGDSIQNEGTIDLNALSDTDASATSVQLIGYGESNAESISETIVKGIEGGDGNNTIINTSTGSITGIANAIANANSYDVQLVGGGKAKAGTTASATAVGVAGGKDADSIQNEGSINLTSQSSVFASSTSIKFSGEGTADAASTANAVATGIDGGDGENTIINTSTGSINVSSNAIAQATGVTANIGIGLSNAGTTTKAVSTGVRTNDDADYIYNEGNINVTTAASTGAGGGSLGLMEFSTADSFTEAIAEGINAGAGKDVIINTGSITVGTVQDNDHPMAESNAEGVSLSIFGVASAILGAKAKATGIIGGGGDDTILNSGKITVGDDDWMTLGISKSIIFSFLGVANTGTIAETTATGIDGGDGGDTITNDNTGNIIVKATSYSKATGSAEGPLFGSPSANAKSIGKSFATGINGGEGNDVIENAGNIDADAYARADANATAEVGWGTPEAEARAKAEATAMGMDAGNGNNAVSNNGTLNVRAAANTIPYSESNTDIDTNTARAYSDSIANAFGIKASDGDDVIQNQGQIIVEAVAEKATSDDQRTTAWADEHAKVGTSKDDPGIRSSATATGISAGGGTNQIANDGSITVKVTVTGDGYAFAESDAYDTETIIWAVVEANATGIATGQGSSQIINNGVVQVSSIAYSEIYSHSDSVDDADATGGATVTAKAWGINASGNKALITNTGTLDVDANATAKGNSRADSGGDGYGTAIFEANSNADAIGIAASGGGTVWNETQAQITVDAKAMIDASANGDEFGTMGASQEDPGAIAVAKAVGIFMGDGKNRIVNEGSISVNAEGNINAGSRSVSTTRSTHTNTWAKAESTAIGLTVAQGNSSIINTGDLEANAKAIASLNDPDSGWGTYWRSDSWYNADAKTGAYAYSNAIGIEASADNSDKPLNTVIANSGTVTVTSVATARGNAAGDRGGDDYGSATTYAEALAEATGFVVGNGNRLVSIENSGSLGVTSTADTFAFSHGDSDSWSYATSLGYAYGIKVGDNNKLVSIKNSGTMKVESTATSDTADDEPWRQSDASSKVYGIDLGNSNSKIVNSGTLDIISKANAKLYTDEDTAVSTVSSAYATGINTGNGTNMISNGSLIQVTASAESNPSGGNSNSTNTASAEANGIKTGSNSDTIISGAGGLVNVAANATTFSYNGVTNASAIGIDAGDGANQITNYGVVNIDAKANAEVKREDILFWSITYPATAVSNVTGIKSGTGADIINNYGQVMVNSGASAVINQVLDLSAGTKSATSNAIGIDAGNGDNFVANYGTIDVSALAAAGTGANPNARTDGVENTTAIGIKTGDGNDTIINSGTINTANQRLEWVGGWIHIANQPGIAITTGAGNDQVFLMNGSTTTGSIDLGDGDDRLTFTGAPIVTGNVTGANGIDTLVFDGTGSVGCTPAAFENAIKQGLGTYSVAGLPTMQRIEMKQGVLQVNSNYQFSDTGFFETFVNGDGSFGQFKVNGTTELAGDLSVLKGSGPYKNGTTYNIIEADAVNGAFSNVMLPAPNNFVNFGLHRLPTLIQIEAYVKPFTWLARSRVEWAVANYLDRILPSSTGDLWWTLGQIQNLSESEYSTALLSLRPDSYDNFTRTTFSMTHRYTKSLQYRMNNVRSYLHVSQPGNEAPILLAHQGSDVGQLFSPGVVSQTQGKNGLWFDAFGQWGDQGGKDGYTGFDYFMRGATAGFDHNLTDQFMAGISIGYSRSDIDLDDDQGSGYIKSLYGSIYGSYFFENLYIDGILSYGKNWFDNHRLITIGTDQRRAYSKHDGDLFSAYLQGGYYFDIKKWLIGPFTSLQYIYLAEEDFREKGAGNVSLNIDGRRTDSLVSELGVRLTRVFKVKYGSLIPELSAAWLHDFDIDDRVIRSSFAGSPGASFSIKGQDVERNGATLGAGITIIHKNGLSTSLKYVGEFRDKYKSNGIMGEVRFTF